jgi:protein involved in polysaccharide export with SLBB domain
MMGVSSGYSVVQRNSDRPVASAGSPPAIRVQLRNVLATTSAICTLAIASACSPVPNLPPAPPVPEPGAGYVSNLEPYRIQVADVLAVRLMLNPELNEEVTVRPDGHISTTVVKDELAYGRTVPELAAALARDYQSDLRNPRLTVVVRSFAPIRIYVGGEVNNPGEFINVGPTLTLSQAIARAGGVRITSDENKVFLIRRGPNDVPQFFSARFQDIMWGKDPTADIRLAPYDLVYVPRTGISEVFRFFNQYFLQFVPVSWGFSYLVNNGGGGTAVVPGATSSSSSSTTAR